MKTLLLAFTICVSSWGAPSPSRTSAEELIRNRSFSAKRDLVSYIMEFPKEFLEDLASLGPTSQILHAGAGAAYFSEEVVALKKLPERGKTLSQETQRTLFRLLEQPLKKRPFVTAISLQLERPGIPNYEGHLKLLWGRFFAEIPDSELGHFDLIVDMGGIFAYSPDADEVIRRYVKLLKPNGIVYLYLGDKDDGFGFQSLIKKKDGTQVPLAGWVEKLAGLKVLSLEGNSGARAFRITLDESKTPSVPTLTLLGIDTQKSGPPTRIYFEK